MTRPCRHIIFFIGFWGIGSFFLGCKKEKSGRINIEGFHLTNPNGDLYGHHGPEDDDWVVMEGSKAGADILALFDFPATEDISDTKEADIPKVSAYPNPAYMQQGYHFSCSEVTLVKLVVVDKNLKVLNRQAIKLKKGSNVLHLDFSDRSKFPLRAEMRVYYSFSAPGKSNYLYGYGDIKICESSLSDCF